MVLYQSLCEVQTAMQTARPSVQDWRSFISSLCNARFLARSLQSGIVLSHICLGVFFTAIADNDNMQNGGLGGHTCETLKEKRETALFPTASGHDSQV